MSKATQARVQTTGPELLRAVKRVKAAAKTAPGEATVRIGVDEDGDLFVEGAGLYAGRVFIDAEVDELLHSSVGLAALEAALKGMAEVTLTTTADGLVVRSGRKRAKLPEVAEWFDPTFHADGDAVIHADAGELSRAVTLASVFASDVDTRPLLQVLTIRGGWMYATDSFRLVRLPVPGLQDDDVELVIPAKALKTALRGAREGGVVIERGETAVRVQRTGEVWLIALENDRLKPPAYEALIDGHQAGDTDAVVDGQALYEAFGAAAEVLPTGRGARLRIGTARATVVADHEGQRVSESAPIIEQNGKSMEAHLNPRFAADALGVLGDEVRITGRGGVFPAMFTSGDALALVMPVKP
jgi:DNA polymerase III sliding clamp (beta) subunit (PCNA family)